MYNKVLFYDDCNKWDNKQCDRKNWEKFQAYFRAAQRKYKRKQKVSTRAGGYHRTNHLREMDGTHNALINLATAAVADIETMMLQYKTISNLTTSAAALTQQLQQANIGYNRGSGISVDRQGKTNPKWPNRKHVRAVGQYCWTHGHCVDINHDSRTCRSKREVHRKNATRNNSMGRNLYGKPRT